MRRNRLTSSGQGAVRWSGERNRRTRAGIIHYCYCKFAVNGFTTSVKTAVYGRVEKHEQFNVNLGVQGSRGP